MNDARSLAQRIVDRREPFTLFHTRAVVGEELKRAIAANKSMDLDVSIDSNGRPYLGHSEEYYQISERQRPKTMPFEDAIGIISNANIPVIVDCKDNRAWDLTHQVVSEIGASRCMVHAFVSELRFGYDPGYDHDYSSEWSDLSRLISLKEMFPLVTTTVSCKFLPRDLLSNPEHAELRAHIRRVADDNNIDTVCLNVPDDTVSDEVLEYFLESDILLHVNIDRLNDCQFTRPYVGETDNLSDASEANLLGY